MVFIFLFARIPCVRFNHHLGSILILNIKEVVEIRHLKLFLSASGTVWVLGANGIYFFVCANQLCSRNFFFWPQEPFGFWGRMVFIFLFARISFAVEIFFFGLRNRLGFGGEWYLFFCLRESALQ